MAVHAAGESAGLARVDPDAHAVVLEATADQLAALERRLVEAGVPHAAIREPDPPYLGELLAIGLAPGERAPLRRFLSELPLHSKPRRTT